MMAFAQNAINWTKGYFFEAAPPAGFDLCLTTWDSFGTANRRGGVGGSGTRGVTPW